MVLETAVGDWSLVFNARIARWEASDRVIVLRASQGGEVAIMDGADVTLGGAAAFGDDPEVDYDTWSRTVTWVEPLDGRCGRAAVWVAGTAALQGS